MCSMSVPVPLEASWNYRQLAWVLGPELRKSTKCSQLLSHPLHHRLCGFELYKFMCACRCPWMPEERIRFLELNLGSCELSDVCLEAQRGSFVRAVCTLSD